MRTEQDPPWDSIRGDVRCSGTMIRALVWLGVVLFGCSRPVPVPSPAAEPEPSASTRPPIVAPTSRGPLVLPSSVDAIVLRPDGRVLLSAKPSLFEWDSQGAGAVRRVELGERQEDRSPFFSSRAERFVVARVDDTTTHLELWDRASLQKVGPLEGSWATTNGMSDFSADGSRFAYTACISRAPDAEDGYTGWSDCDTAIYALPEGTLLRRIRMERVQTDMFLPYVRLSPNGEYVGVGHEIFETEVFHVRTGRRVYKASSSEAALDDGAHFVFVDDTHLLTSSRSGGVLQLHALGGAPPAKKLDLQLTSQDVVRRVLLSPRRAHAATLLARGDRCRVVLWTFASGASSSYLVPKELQPDCAMHWDDADTLLVGTAKKGATSLLRIDATTGKSSIEPTSDLPALREAGFEVFTPYRVVPVRRGFGVAYTSEEMTDLGTQGIVRVGEARVAVELEPNRSVLEVVNDRLLLGSPRRIQVIGRDGKVAQLELQDEIVRKP